MKGSTLIHLPKDIVNNVFKYVKGAHRDITGQYVVPCNTQNLPEISIQLNNTDFTITPKHYLITSGVVIHFFFFFMAALGITNFMITFSLRIQKSIVILISKIVLHLLTLY